MKLLLVGDMHIGARSSLSKIFADYFVKSWKHFILPIVKEHEITEVFQLGDLFDNRKHLETATYDIFKDELFNELKSHGINLHVLIGNHDIYWRDSLSVNTPELVLSNEYSDNIKIYNTPTTLEYENLTMDIIPWICNENRNDVENFIRTSKSELCLGHFEFAGFPMYKGIDAKKGDSINPFNKYERVISGHYHTYSSQDNITYLGTPYEINWMDCNDPKYVAIFDTITRQLELIQNPFNIHEKIVYNNGYNGDIQLLENKFVKVIVSNRDDTQLYLKFAKDLEEINTLSLSFIDESFISNSSDVNVEEIKISSTLEFIKKYVDGLDENVNKNKLKEHFELLYVEALNDTV